MMHTNLNSYQCDILSRCYSELNHTSLQLPTFIADNGGYDSAELVSKLRALHTDTKYTYGLGKNRPQVDIDYF